MCGIAGELRLRPGGEGASWEELSRRMARRGPDDHGLWHDGRCTLAFRRLAILDLSPTGRQPMADPGGRYRLVFNGELYNFRQLKGELEATGVAFRSTGDAEVVLHALARWGPPALARFRGMFALALYDGAERSLLLARDHAGIKPLYCLRAPEGVVFASQYDQLLAHPWARHLTPSGESLGLLFRLGYLPPPWALLEGTRSVEPGTWLRFDGDGGETGGRFFTFPQPQGPMLAGAEAVEAVDEAVGAAVRRHLVSDVPVGVFLSGGVDSPLVAAAAREAGGSLPAFTIATPDPALDEAADAARYAAELGLTHQVETITEEAALALIDDAVAACGEPLADASILPTLLVSRLARRQVKVVLSGDGGDELFWGYAERFGSVLAAAAEYRRPAWWRSARWAARRVLGVGGGHPNLRWPSLGAWYRAKHSRIPEAWLGQVLPELPPWPERCTAFDYDGWEPAATARWLRDNELATHLAMVLMKVDRASMYHSLEVRVPLLDREVMEVAARLDWRACLDLEARAGKLPLRAALARRARFQSRQKRGFTVPLDAWLRGPLLPLFRQRVIDRQELLGVPLAGGALTALLDRHLAGEVAGGRALWTLLTLALWEDRYGRGAALDTATTTPERRHA